MSQRFFLSAIAVALAACTPAATTTSTTSSVATTATTIAAPSVILGVLENRPGATTTEPARFVVRATFFKEGAVWRAYDSACSDEVCLTSATSRFPQQTNWTIGFDGRAVGQVAAATPHAWVLYADIGQQELAAGAHAPTQGAKTTEFSSDTPLYRPLVASSAANVGDPQSWAPSALPAATLQALRQAFRAKFSGVVNCANAEAAPSPRTYADSDIDIAKTFDSSGHWNLATLHLTGYRCDGPTDDSAYADQVFAVSPTGEVKFLGEGLKLVDAGDYDNDGQSELVFAIQGGNRGGYDLFSNAFVDRAEFAFSYH